jgi:hypothetical protein
MKNITFLRSSMPDNPIFGYGDHVQVLDENDCMVFADHCSTCPNAFKIMPDGSRLKYTAAYGMLAEGIYDFRCIGDHPKYGKCLLIDDGGNVPSCIPDVRHDGQMIMDGVFVHTGESAEWRGSAGCLTISPVVADNFFSCFTDGETGKITIKKLIESIS